LQSIKDSVAGMLKQCEDRKAALTAARENMAAATTSLDAERAEATKQAEETKAKHAEKEECRKARADIWDPLKACEFAGKEWRARDKKIVQATKLLEYVSAPTSLVKAVEVVFKTKVQDRGEFATKALEHGEAALAAHLERLDSWLASAGEEAAALAHRVQCAEVVVQEATAAEKEAWDTWSAGQDEWAVEQSKQNEKRESDQADRAARPAA
jgi:hypothetical protein